MPGAELGTEFHNIGVPIDNDPYSLLIRQFRNVPKKEERKTFLKLNPELRIGVDLGQIYDIIGVDFEFICHPNSSVALGLAKKRTESGDASDIDGGIIITQEQIAFQVQEKVIENLRQQGFDVCMEQQAIDLSLEYEAMSLEEKLSLAGTELLGRVVKAEDGFVRFLSESERQEKLKGEKNRLQFLLLAGHRINGEEHLEEIDSIAFGYM